MLRTRAPWRDLPARFGPWSTAWSRLRCWTAVGLWQRILDALRRLADGEGRVDWTARFVDGPVVRAHQHAAGAIGGQYGEALGRSRGGFATRIHVRAEAGGKPMAFVRSSGECHESRYIEALLAAGAASGPGPPPDTP